MRLELGHIYIKDIQFASESKIENGVLYVSEEAVKAVALEDEKIKSVSFDIAKPGEWIPGRYHRYDRPWSRLYTILQDTEPGYGM